MTHTYHGDIDESEDTLTTYARDISVFRVQPKRVYYPKNLTDVQALVELCNEDREHGGTASIAPRAGGTCMSGGSLTPEWILDMTRYMSNIIINPETQTAEVEMGAYFRDIEDAARVHGLMFASYPSSHRICGIGGMIGNNASGEKSLRHGPTSANVLSLEMVLADGSVTTLTPKEVAQVREPRERVLLELSQKHQASLSLATGEVPKAASGYRLEKILHDSTFSEIPLIVGAQGTLGIVTKAVLKLVPIPENLDLLLISAQSLTDIPDIINTVRTHNPEGLETFDINTYKKAEEFLSEHTTVVAPFLDLSSHLFILAQFSENTAEMTREKRVACEKELKEKGYFVHHSTDENVVGSAWEIRRHSFLLMRDYNPEGHRAVPCIEDVIVPFSKLDTFIGELNTILTRRHINYGFHGHIGDGSLRIVPVFDFHSPTLLEDILGLTKEVFVLVKRLKGNMSADHSDGIIRTPFLKDFYGETLFSVFEEIKRIYDPKNIFNPNKKVGGDVFHIDTYLDR